MLYFPKVFQLFGSTHTGDVANDGCDNFSELSWLNMTKLVVASSVAELTAPSESKANINCLKVTIYEMNIGKKAMLENMISMANYMGAVLSIALAEWQNPGRVPAADYYCKNGVTSGPVQSLNQCSRRTRSNLYDLDNGYVTCHCDSYCTTFGDCCGDFSFDSFSENDINENLSPDTMIQCVSQEFPRTKDKGLGFYLITSCHRYFYDSEIVAKCQFKENERSIDILVYIPVTVQNVPYRNMYCAMCNNKQVSKNHFWKSKVYAPRPIFVCNELVVKWDRNPLVANFFRHPECHAYGYFYPLGEFLQGHSRLGKMCIQAGATPSFGTAQQPVFVLMHLRNVEVVDSDCICKSCDERLHPYLTADFRHQKEWFSDSEKKRRINQLLTGHGSPVWSIFTPSDDRDEQDFRMEATSLTGCALSIFLLAITVIDLIHKKALSTKPRRCQLGILLGKLLFFLSFFAGFLGRNIALVCKISAVILHFAICVSYSYMMWYGFQVSQLLWKINHNMAALTVENQRRRSNFVEMIVTTAIWLFSSILVITTGIYDALVDDSFFKYGKKEICLISGKLGQRYFIIIPTGFMVLINVFSVIFSCAQLRAVWETISKEKVSLKLVKFLGNMVVFQSVQYIFGVVYYLTSNDVIKIVFEVLVIFEGTFISFSHFFNRLQSIFGGKKRSIVFNSS